MLRNADKRIVNKMKVFIERNNLQLELIRYRKNVDCIHVCFCEVMDSMQFCQPNAYHSVPLQIIFTFLNSNNKNKHPQHKEQQHQPQQQLRLFALQFIHSHSGATGVFWLKCHAVYFKFGDKITDASSKINIRRLEVGDLLIKVFVHCTLYRSSIHCSQSAAISIAVARQWRNLERIQCV